VWGFGSVRLLFFFPPRFLIFPDSFSPSFSGDRDDVPDDSVPIRRRVLREHTEASFFIPLPLQTPCAGEWLDVYSPFFRACSFFCAYAFFFAARLMQRKARRSGEKNSELSSPFPLSETFRGCCGQSRFDPPALLKVSSTPSIPPFRGNTNR